MELKKLQSKVLKEVVLVALTYRVSYKNIAKIFNTTVEDVKEAFELLDFNTNALSYLNEETILEDEINEKYAYVHAYNYFKKRNSIIKELKNSNDKVKIIELKNELKLLHRLIDDSIVLDSKDKKYLSEEEKDSLARYRLKYYLSITSMKSVTNRSKETIRSCESQLAEKDLIYQEKLEELNNFYDKLNKNYFHNNY